MKDKITIITVDDYKIFLRGFVLKKSTADEIDLAIMAAMSGDSYFSQDLLKLIIKSLNRVIETSKTEKKEIAKFTDCEKEVLKLICEDYSNPVPIN